MMTVTLLAIRALGDGSEVELCFEMRDGDQTQRERAVLSSADFADLRLLKGEVSTACMDAVLAAGERHSARKRALRILTYGRCSEKRLIQKLRAKGVACSIARETAALLSEEGYLDGGEDALREAEKDLLKLWGERRIVADLRAKGYESEAIAEAISSLRESADFSEACAERIRKSFGAISDDPQERQKQIASLERAGFTFAQIRRAIELTNE